MGLLIHFLKLILLNNKGYTFFISTSSSIKRKKNEKKPIACFNTSNY